MDSYLYLTNGKSNNISMYSIEDNGLLTSLSPSKVASENSPQNIEAISINSINYAYVPNASSNSISCYSISNDGIFLSLNKATIPTGNSPVSVSISQRNGLRYLYATNTLDGTISMYSIATNGELNDLSPDTISTGRTPVSSIVINVNNTDYLYVTNAGDKTVSMYSIQANGQLQPLENATISIGNNPQYIATININGTNYVYVTSPSDRNIFMYYIGTDGQLIPLRNPFISVGNGSVSFLTIKVITMNNRNYAYIPNFDENVVSVYSVSNDGLIESTPRSTVSTGSNPFFFDLVSMNGATYAYISNDNVSNDPGYSISMYSISSDGSLTALSPPIIITGNGSNVSSNYIKIVSIPQPFPVSNICFLGYTLIQTDQGYTPIYKIKHDKHTIGGKKIVDITRTKTKDPYLVCFKKHALGTNLPMEKTVMSADHKVLLNGKLTEAKNFVGKVSGVTYVKYNGEILYNILMEDYSIIKANNLTCETLHPANMIAKLYTRKSTFSVDEREKIVFQLQDCVDKKNTEKYKQIMKKC